MKTVLPVIKQWLFFSIIKNNESVLMNTLKILGISSCASLGGVAGYAICGLIGMSFGLVLGYVTGKLLLDAMRKIRVE